MIGTKPPGNYICSSRSSSWVYTELPGWYGGFLKWWYPQNTPKWSFLVGKPTVVGYHHFRNPPYVPCYLPFFFFNKCLLKDQKLHEAMYFFCIFQGVMDSVPMNAAMVFLLWEFCFFQRSWTCGDTSKLVKQGSGWNQIIFRWNFRSFLWLSLYLKQLWFIDTILCCVAILWHR